MGGGVWGVLLIFYVSQHLVRCIITLIFFSNSNLSFWMSIFYGLDLSLFNYILLFIFFLFFYEKWIGWQVIDGMLLQLELNSNAFVINKLYMKTNEDHI